MLHRLHKAGIVVSACSRKQGERGHGVRRKYSFTNLASSNVVKKLCESGVSPIKVNKAIRRELQGTGISLRSLPAFRVVILEKNAYDWNDRRKNPFKMSDRQQALGFIYDLPLMRDELVADNERLAA